LPIFCLTPWQKVFSSCFDRSCPENAQECGIFQNKKVAPTECRLEHKNNYEISIIKNARLLKDVNGTVVRVVETITDLTELTLARQKIEEARQKLLEIRQPDRQKQNISMEIYEKMGYSVDDA
jgi:two-component system, NtrC family, response regulator HydG